MSINDRVQQVSDDYTSMVERVVSYYARYVDSMWRVVVLHNRFALDAESWKAHILPYEEKFYEHIGLEHTLYMTAGQLLTDANDSADAVVDIRAQGLQDKLDLDTLHAELEHDLVMDLLAQRTMTKENAVRIRWMSAYRLSVMQDCELRYVGNSTLHGSTCVTSRRSTSINGQSWKKSWMLRRKS